MRRTEKQLGRAPYRYAMEERTIPWKETFKRIWSLLKRKEIYMRPIKEGEPEYEEALFEETFIWKR